ncbi:MAG: efflux RND transporter permease subunit [Longimicrobiales bacterium]|nr:efflux RND transporter permease subunit [Longimicrobiales bacterium]
MIGLSIRRPVAVAMTYLAVGLLGLAAWRNIPIELLPDTQLPRLSVRGSWPGASPETIEAFLTSPIESTIQQIRGVEKVTSESFEQQGSGVSNVEVEFARDTDMDFARLDLSERLATLEEGLPPGVRSVTVEPYVPPEFSAQAGRAFLRYTLTGPYTLEALRTFLDDQVAPELGQLDGVAVVRVYGGRDRLVEIEMEEDRVSALGLTPGQVFMRINDLDLVREAGSVRSGDKEYAVTIRNRPSSVQDIRDAIITSAGGRLIRVSDVAVVRDTYEEAFSYYRIDGSPAVAFVVMKEVGANTVKVAEVVKARMAELETRLPIGTRVILDQDESKDIKKQLTDLRYRAMVSAVVIFVVLLVFLGTFRSAAVIFATIAFSVLIALNLIYFGGLSLNLLTLMGLAMGFGLIVDNSIVVLENIYRRWQGGDPPLVAAQVGAQQVVLPIMAATATTLIVFVPFVYLQGDLRVYYVPLAIVVGLTLLASLFVAFTFIPALAGRILDARPGFAALWRRKSRTVAIGWEGELDPGQALYVRVYRAIIRGTLQYPWAAIVVAVACLGGSFYLFNEHVTRGVVWGGGWGQQTYVDIRITLPRGSDLERTDELALFFEERLAALPEVERYTTQVTGTYANIRVSFPEELENTAVPPAIKEQMVAYSLGFSGAEVRVYGFGPSFYGGGGSPPNYSIKILGYNYERVRDIAEDLGSRLQRMARIQDVDTNASGSYFDRDKATEFAVEIDRGALARYDMTVQDFVGRMNSVIRGQTSQSLLKIGGEELRFDVKVEGFQTVDLHELQETIITGSSGTGIRIGDVVTISPKEILARIRRENQQYERTVAYEFRGPTKLGDLTRDAVIGSTVLPPGYTIEEADTWRWSEDEREQIYFVLAISILLIFMVTAALFESLVQPLCVLLTVPMALIGVFLMFFYANATFTREAYIGVIMMGGIVVNNAILLVDHINQIRRDATLSLRDSILKGTLERVRPILMTTTTTVLGLLPLVLFSQGADSNIWNALAYALIGGLLSSTIFVLTTTPALYYLFEGGWRRL